MVKLFADDKMYCSIRSTCMRVMNDAKEIKLHPVELFYLSLCVIDRMKGLTANEAVAYVLDEVWYEGQEYFIKVYGEDSDIERNAALGLILQTCNSQNPTSNANLRQAVALIAHFHCISTRKIRRNWRKFWWGTKKLLTLQSQKYRALPVTALKNVLVHQAKKNLVR